MKNANYKIFLLTFLITNTLSGQQKELKLTFTALYQLNYTGLDSIVIKNMTMEEADTVLYKPDTMLVLYFGEESKSFKPTIDGFELMQNIPNPFENETYINIYLPEKGKVEIKVFNLLGQIKEQRNEVLDAGINTFVFRAANENHYLLFATYKGIVKTIKLVNLNTGENKNNDLLIYQGANENKGEYKKAKGKSNFKYAYGDKLRYIGYAQNQTGIEGYDVIEDVPDENKNYIFNITEGLPCNGKEIVTYSDQIYRTVQIGNQCWFKENINVGNKIIGSINQSNNNVIEKYCYFNEIGKCAVYGGLYQWNEMMQYSTSPGAQGICPAGWHIPTDAEWCVLTQYIDQTVNCNTVGWSGTDIGNKMKVTEGWGYFDEGNNISGFTGIPAGSRSTSGWFHFLGSYAIFYTSTSTDPYSAIYRKIGSNNEQISRYTPFKQYGYSVRCLKN